MTFNELKKQSKSNNIDSLVAELEKQKGKSYVDDRFWTIPIDEKTGNGTAVIRFLPPAADNPLPWVTYYSHSFKGVGGWYIENSLTTIGQPDPLSELNSEMWATGIEANKNLVRERKRRQNYIANILVIEDPKNPENEGKVFLFRFGKKIFGKIQEKLQPEFAGDTAIDVFDFWKGANFKLRVKKVEGYPNYDSSMFEGQSPLLGGNDVKLEALWNTLYDLREFTDPKNFKTYAQLKDRLDRVLGIKKADGPSAGKEMEAPSIPSVATQTGDAPWSTDDDDSSESESENDMDSGLDYFKDLSIK